MLIYISGIDGCGKTTQAKLLVDTLRKRGFNADYEWMRWEPTFRRVIKSFRSLIARRKIKEHDSSEELENNEHDHWNKFKRKLLSNPVIKELWWLYACADYYFSICKEFRNLYGEITIIDRYIDDFIIDQAINFNLSPEDSVKLENNVFLKKFKPPDLKIIIDLPAIEGYTRKKDGTSLKYLEKREAYYKRLYAVNNSVHLDGFEDIPSLASKIDKCVTDILIRD